MEEHNACVNEVEMMFENQDIVVEDVGSVKPVQKQENIKSASTTPTETATRRTFHCTTCDTIINFNNRNRHFETIQHKSKLHKSDDAPIPDSNDPPLYELDPRAEVKDELRKQRKKESYERRKNERYFCEVCKLEMSRLNKTRHMKTKNHIVNLHFSNTNMNKNSQDEDEQNSVDEFYNDLEHSKFHNIVKDNETFYICYTCDTSDSMNHLNRHVASFTHHSNVESDQKENIAKDLKRYRVFANTS